MMLSNRRVGTAVILTISAAFLLIGLFVSDGFFNIDEFIYFIGADAFNGSGGLTVENGIEGVTSPDLRIMLLVSGPDGLTPQYPAGAAFFGGALIPVFGQHALIALNILAGIGTLFAAHALARRLFNSIPVANLTVILLTFATFWAEYVFGHWPHSISVFFTTLALVKFLDAIPAGDSAWRPALLSGLAVGAGLLFRLDGILVLPAIAVATVFWAARPVQILAAGAAGLAPGFALLSITNHIKFDTWNPLSYGSTGGGTDPSSHLMAGGILVAGFAGLLCWRWFQLAQRPAGRVVLLIGLAGLAAAAIAFPAQIGKLLAGTSAIMFDATAITDQRPGIVPHADGTRIFWGFPKKALFQSLPWLGCLVFMATGAWRQHQRSLGILLILFVIWLLPFAKSGWHGGLGSNMRYFLPLLPALVAAGAWVIWHLSERLPTGRTVLIVAACAGALASTFIISIDTARAAQFHQIWSTYAFFAVAIASLIAGVLTNRTATVLALSIIGIGIGLAVSFGASDFQASQKHRALAAVSSGILAERPEPVLYYGRPAAFGTAIGHPGRVLALPSQDSGNQPDPALIESACAAGYSIIAMGGFAEMIGRSPILSMQHEETTPGLPKITEFRCDG